LEVVVIHHILVPLDGSTLAECVLPHVLALAPVTKARVTLIHVLEHSDNRNGSPPIDPMGWHMQKQESHAYLEQKARQLNEQGLEVSHVVLEGNAAESIIEYARLEAVDLIALSTHGRTGLSGWNVSSVVQKVLLRSYRSILLVRAYAADRLIPVHYKRLFVASDGSTRSEHVFPFAISVAQHYKSLITLGTVIERPHFIQRLPPSQEELALIDQLTVWNQTSAEHFHQQVATQLTLKNIDIETQIETADHVLGALHTMIEQAKADLVLIVAHGDTGEQRWPYGSVTTSLIAHGNTPLLVIQDLSEHNIQPTSAEQATGESRGH
jgi:nucleotide-binding universal stress UspA family protein